MDFDGITKVVYSSSGGTVAPKTFDDATATAEDQPVSMHLDSPYQISKIVGEFYSNYYSDRHGLPVSMVRFQNVYGPGEVLGAGRWRGSNTVWRNVTPTFVYKALKGETIPVQNGGVATRDFIYVGDIARGLIATALHGRAGRRLQHGERHRDHDPGARRDDRRARRRATPRSSSRPAREWDHSGKRFGDPVKAREAARLLGRGARCARASSARSSGRARTSTGSRAASSATASSSSEFEASATAA